MPCFTWWWSEPAWCPGKKLGQRLGRLDPVDDRDHDQDDPDDDGEDDEQAVVPHRAEHSGSHAGRAAVSAITRSTTPVHDSFGRMPCCAPMATTAHPTTRQRHAPQPRAVVARPDTARARARRRPDRAAARARQVLRRSSRRTSTSSSWCASPGLLDQVVVRASSVRSPDGRTPQQTLAEIRERVLELTAAQSRLWRDELCPALAAEGILDRHASRTRPRTSCAELERRLRAPDLPGADAARGRARASRSRTSRACRSASASSCATPSPARSASRASRCPEGLPRFVAVGDARPAAPARGRDRALPAAGSSPRWRSSSAPPSALTRDGDTEISDDADDLLEAVESELRKRRFGAVVRLEVSSSISRAMLDAARRAARRPADGVYPVHGLLDLADVGAALRARPARPEVRAVGAATRSGASQRRPDGDLFAEIAQRDILVQHPYDSFATSVEAFVRAAATRSRT